MSESTRKIKKLIELVKRRAMKDGAEEIMSEHDSEPRVLRGWIYKCEFNNKQRILHDNQMSGPWNIPAVLLSSADYDAQQAELARLRAENDSMSAIIQGNNDCIAELRAALETVKAEATRLREEAEAQRKSAVDAYTELIGLREDYSRDRRLLYDRMEECERIPELEKELEAAKAERDQKHNDWCLTVWERDRLQRECTTAHAGIDYLWEQLTDTRGELGAAKGERDKKEHEYQGLVESYRCCDNSRITLLQKLTTLRAELESAKAELIRVNAVKAEAITQAQEVAQKFSDVTDLYVAERETHAKTRAEHDLEIEEALKFGFNYDLLDDEPNDPVYAEAWPSQRENILAAYHANKQQTAPVDCDGIAQKIAATYKQQSIPTPTDLDRNEAERKACSRCAKSICSAHSPRDFSPEQLEAIRGIESLSESQVPLDAHLDAVLAQPEPPREHQPWCFYPISHYASCTCERRIKRPSSGFNNRRATDAPQQPKSPSATFTVSDPAACMIGKPFQPRKPGFPLGTPCVAEPGVITRAKPKPVIDDADLALCDPDVTDDQAAEVLEGTVLKAFGPFGACGAALRRAVARLRSLKS